MKLISSMMQDDTSRIICNDAIFDPDLITVIGADTDEKMVCFKYDHSECGNPLGLGFEVEVKNVSFMVKFTQHDIHICASVEVGDDLPNELNAFVGKLGEIQFDVRMTNEEKIKLLIKLMNSLRPTLVV